jgi:DNA-binding NarL/FixJ family response regulator
MIRILIADDHDVVRSGLRNILEAQPDWKIVAEAADGKEAIGKAMITTPDVAVVDYALPLISGLEVTRQIRRRVASTEVLIFTMLDSDLVLHDLLAAGARGYLLKSDANRYLIEAVESLAEHKPFFTAQVSETLLQDFIRQPMQVCSPLTAREREVVRLIAEGHSSRQIAHLLDLTLKTVETHRATVMRKLDLSSFAALVRYAVRNKLVEP